MKKKARLRTANPLAARVCETDNDDGRLEADRFGSHSRAQGAFGSGGRGGVAYDHSVVPGKDGKLIEASDEIPSSGDVASYEDAKS